jgi:hypothetical protein
MSDKLRAYLTFDEASSCALRPEAKCGRPTLRHKVILAKAEQAGQCAVLLERFCAAYNAQAGVPDAHRLDAADLHLRVGTTVVQANFTPVTNYVADYNDVAVAFSAPPPPVAQHEPGSVPCTNFGCGKRFVPGRDDVAATCEHHAGRPVFHDTYKYWSCCPEKRSMEFEEFERVPPCARGVHRHDLISSAVAVSGGGGSATVDRKPLTEDEVRALDAKVKGPAAAAAAAAPALPLGPDAAPVRGPREFSAAGSAAPAAAAPDADGKFRCRRHGCGKKFAPADNAPDACRYHKAGPVFHDTYKYWSCCPDKKHAEFDEFAAVPGCAVAEHLA